MEIVEEETGLLVVNKRLDVCTFSVHSQFVPLAFNIHCVFKYFGFLPSHCMFCLPKNNRLLQNVSRRWITQMRSGENLRYKPRPLINHST